jgi:hypothetical protein
MAGGDDDLVTKKGPAPNRERLARVETMVNLTMSNAAIVEAVTKEFGCSVRTVYKDIERVELLLEEQNKRKRDQMRARRRASLEDLYRRSLNAGDRITALGCLDRLCKIDGLYAPTEVTVSPGGPEGGITGTVVRIKAMAPVERQRELERLAEKRARLAPPPRNCIDIAESSEASTAHGIEDEDND